MINNISLVTETIITFPKTFQRVLFCKLLQLIYNDLIIFNRLVMQIASA
jgi:hypothetical protein